MAAAEQIAQLSATILEAPEENLKLLKDLHSISSADGLLESKIAILSEMAVFKDILPDYRIRLLSEKEKGVKVSSDVKRVRNYEEGLLAAYQRFVEFLQKAAKSKSKKPVIVRSMCELLTSKPYFNFRSDLVRTLIPIMNDRQKEIAVEACAAIAEIFDWDTQGDVSLDAVQQISRYVKHKNFNVRPEMLNTFLKLKLEFAGEYDTENRQHIPKKGKISKAQYKAKQEERELQKKLKEAEAEINKERRSKNHTETLNAVFVCYFRVINGAPRSPLLASVLEGLGRNAHLINVDFLGDMLQALKRLVAEQHLGIAESIHCAISAFQALKAQGEAVLYDPKDFHTMMYALIPKLAAPENEQHIRPAVRCFYLMLNDRRTNSLGRVAAFVKRLVSLALCVSPSSAVAVLHIVRGFMQKYPQVRRLLDTETTASGVYLPELDDPEHCNAFASSAWELSLMQSHFHPAVRQFTQYAASEAPLPASIASKTAVDLLHEYADVAFDTKPRKHTGKRHKVGSSSVFVASLESECQLIGSVDAAVTFQTYFANNRKRKR
eukprot:TRINITY_DN515_c0_g1_i1.p1 TRINITY_DN515_c0_g1~~TRINITY_DN515_c0_g1_i1.p1  ORF type:complete len:550 (-),score=77.15 TRINITY_DN515_c0_g1_i1:1416-3065(-)